MTEADNDIELIAKRLLGNSVSQIVPAGNGANNRIFRLEDTSGRSYALKIYPSQGKGGRDRLGQEAAAVCFLNQCEVKRVPSLVALLPENKAALYDWVPGERVKRPMSRDIDALAEFLLELQELRGRPEAANLPNASASCFSLNDIVVQANARAREFELCEEPQVRMYVTNEWRPDFNKHAQFAQNIYLERGIATHEPLAFRLRALSPSDFGIHNALRCQDGTLAFLDFEYFGWDDPAKTVADTVLHPGTEMDASGRQRFCQAVVPYFAKFDAEFVFRTKILYSLYGLIWCLICLNKHLKTGAGTSVAVDLVRVRERQRRVGELHELE